LSEHPMVRKRKANIARVREWYQNGMSTGNIVWRAVELLGVTYEKALEYLAVVTRE
jgi:hypothetical protein